MRESVTWQHVAVCGIFVAGAVVSGAFGMTALAHGFAGAVGGYVAALLRPDKREPKELPPPGERE